MKTTTKANFAKTCGVSRQAIDKQCKAGAIGLTTQGKKILVNLDHRLTKDYIQLKTTDTPPPPPPKKKPATPKPKPDPLEITAPIDDGSEEHEITFSSVDDITKENFHLVTKTQIDIIDKYESAKTKKHKREVDEGLYVARTMVHQVFSKLYTVDTNELRTMEDRLVPKLCGVFGFRDDAIETVQARKMITDEVAKAMKHIQRIMNDYLTKIGTEKI